MEDDDEFGDLYSDVLRPLAAQFQPRREEAGTSAPDVKIAATAAASHGRPIDLNMNSDDEEILYGAPDLKNSSLNRSSALGWNLNAPVQGETLPDPKGFDLNLDSNLEAAEVDELAGNRGEGSRCEARVLKKGEGVQKISGGSAFMVDDDDDINIFVEERENKDEDFVERDDNIMNKEQIKETTISFPKETVVAGMGSEQMIPGLSGRLDNPGGSHFEDEWESEESEDDLQIVLNDNQHGPVGMRRMIDEDDEDGEPLVIVADNGDAGTHHNPSQMMMEEQQWGGEEGGPGADGEKNSADAAKASGGGGGAAPAAVQPKIAHSNHVYHPFHSQFKYVRPGAAPIPAAAPGGIPGPVRPPINMGPLVGRGRGDWRPAGMKGALPIQKGFHPGHGTNVAGRGYGSGLDFTLPSYKTIFEVDIDSFEEKPWKLPSIDITDFFNFGLSEDSWKDYCKQLEQLRLETTMQSKIRVYESGRAEQDYDPDLPPELAAAAGIQDTPSQNTALANGDAALTDLARANAPGRSPLPVGRPIPVETGSGDRLPSIDTRRPRLHDTDAIIEILCFSSTDGDNVSERQDNVLAGKDLEGDDEPDDPQQDSEEHMDRLSPAYNGSERESGSTRAQLKNTVSTDEIVREGDFPPEVPVYNHRDREAVVLNEQRSTKGRQHVRSPMETTTDNKRGKQITSDQNKEMLDSGDAKKSPSLSSSAVASDGEQVVVVEDKLNDGSILDDRSFDMDREEMDVDTIIGDTPEDGNSIKKQKPGPRVERSSQEDDDGEGSNAARSSSKAGSGSSKDHRRFSDDIEDEVLQNRRPPRAGNIKKQGDVDNARREGLYERSETERHMVAKRKEYSLSRRSGDGNSSLHRHVKSENADWKKESDISEGSLHRRDGDHHGRRIEVEDTRKREHAGEISSRNRSKVREIEKDEHHQSRNQMDNGSWSGANHDHDIMGSRQRDRDDTPKSRNEKVDAFQSKRRKETARISRDHSEKEDISINHRESSSRRKRERDDGSDLHKRDERARLKDDDVHQAKQKEGGSFQMERVARQRERDEWYRIKQEEILLREREEARSVMRSGRAAEEKPWINHSRGKDDYTGSNREYHSKDVNRHDNQLKRRDQVENESYSLHRAHEDVYARGNQLSNDEKRPRYERPSSRDRRVTYGSDTSRVHEDRQKGSSRKSRELESGDRDSLIPYKKNQDDQISRKVNMRGRTGQQSGEVNVNHNSSKKHKKEASSDDEHPDSNRGRSKLERWTSHKERDFGAATKPPSSLKSRDPNTPNNSLPVEPSKKMEDMPQPLADEPPKATEDMQLDTVAKLKKRSERFKLPIRSEKDDVAVKKIESRSLPSGQTQTRPDSEIKSERPARKRRWTGN